MIKHVRFLFDIPEHLRNKLDDYVRENIKEAMPGVIQWFLDREPGVFGDISPLPFEYRSVLKEIIESIENYETYFTGEYDLENIFCEVQGDVIILELTYDVDDDKSKSEGV